MMKTLRLLILTVVALLLAACAKQMTYDQVLHYKVNEYSKYAEARLKPDFAKAQVNYPPKQITLLVFKHEKRMELWARDSTQSRWHHIKNFRVYAASGGPGPKLHSMDDQVPEGIYHIIGLNPESRFDLSMHVSYPNAFDRYHALLDHRTNLGGDIFIHGNKLSIGCIAIGDTNIQQLFVLADLVGIKNIEVIIAPNDLRYQKPLPSREKVTWLPQLYANIRAALQPFKQKVKGV